MVIKSWASEKGLACNIFKGVGTGLEMPVIVSSISEMESTIQ